MTSDWNSNGGREEVTISYTEYRSLEMKSEAWEAVYTLCNELGMKFTGMSGKDAVLDFIRSKGE